MLESLHLPHLTEESENREPESNVGAHTVDPCKVSVLPNCWVWTTHEV